MQTLILHYVTMEERLEKKHTTSLGLYECHNMYIEPFALSKKKMHYLLVTAFTKLSSKLCMPGHHFAEMSGK